MRQLSFVGLSGDGSALLLTDSRGTSYALAIDGRLAAVLRGDHARPGQLEIALDTLSPKEIQARIRAGATAAELADESGLPLEKIERYEGPPLAERAWVAEQARAAEVHTGGTTLADLIMSAVVDEVGDAEGLRWDAWRREDGRWCVLAAYPVGSVDRVSTWSFDPRSGVLAALDDTAHHLVDGSPVAVLTIVPDTPAEAPAPAEPTTEHSTEHSTEVIATEAGGRPGRKSRRASVPSWDEILFGASQSEE